MNKLDFVQEEEHENKSQMYLRIIIQNTREHEHIEQSSTLTFAVSRKAFDCFSHDEHGLPNSHQSICCTINSQLQRKQPVEYHEERG